MEEDGHDEVISQETTADVVKPPAFDFRNVRETYKLEGASIERQGGSAAASDQIFWRNVSWSPYGTHLLAQCDDHHVDLFRLIQTKDNCSLEKVFSLRAPTTLLAVEWYPFAQYENPSSWCFLIGCRDVPTRLIDAYEGKTRASYGIINHVERFLGAQAISFSLDGSRIFLAVESDIAIFDLNNPGINTHTQFKLTPSKKAIAMGKASAGQKGLISCLAVASDHFAGTSAEVLAVGTYSGTIGVYNMEGTSFSKPEERCLLGWNEKSAGVTHMKFHPAAPHILMVTSRRDNEIRAYDLQHIGTKGSFLHSPEQISHLATFERRTASDKESQQRLGFAVDWAGRYLVAGDTSGSLSVWDIAVPNSDDKAEDVERATSEGDFFGKLLRQNETPVRQQKAHCDHVANDTIASVALHPTLPLLALTSGARHWDMSLTNDDEETNGGFSVRDGAIRLLEATVSS